MIALFVTTFRKRELRLSILFVIWACMFQFAMRSAVLGFLPAISGRLLDHSFYCFGSLFSSLKSQQIESVHKLIYSFPDPPLNTPPHPPAPTGVRFKHWDWKRIDHLILFLTFLKNTCVNWQTFLVNFYLILISPNCRRENWNFKYCFFFQNSVQQLIFW